MPQEFAASPILLLVIGSKVLSRRLTICKNFPTIHSDENMNASKLLLTLGILLLGAAFTEGRTFTKVWFGRSEPDGIVVSPDNSTVYVAVLGHVSALRVRVLS
jgi:hypothetical protein